MDEDWGIAREREVEIRESKVLNDYYKQTEEKVEKKNMCEGEERERKDNVEAIRL